MRAITSRTTTRGRGRRALAAAALLVAALAPVLVTGSSAQAAPDDRATLFYIRTSGTPSGRVEIHTATAASRYQQADLHTTTYFRTTEARQGYFQMVGRTLWFLKVCETGRVCGSCTPRPRRAGTPPARTSPWAVAGS